MAAIDKIEIFMVDLSPPKARGDAIQSFASQETPIVRITDRDGAIGVGYTYTIGTGGHSIVQLIRRTLAPMLLGREADHIEARWREMFFATHATTVGPLTSLAIAALDIALWDLKSKRAKLPLHIFAGGAQSGVPVYSTEGGWLHLSDGQIVEGVLEAKSLGFHGAKIKVGLPPRKDVARLSAAREAVGGSFEIFVDANQSFQLDEGIRRADGYKELGIGWLEEPFEADDLHNHIELSAKTSVPIAVGESLYSTRQFATYLQARACSIVQVDVARVGGVTPWLKVAHLAEAFNVAVCPHFLMEIHIALCCAVPNARWLEYIPQLDSITTTRLTIKDGMALPSPTAGTGIEWDWEKIQASHNLEAHFLIE